jgi:hypothetical protein
MRKRIQFHIIQHKRFVLYGAHPNSAFGGTSFMLGTLCAMLVTLKNERNKNRNIKGEINI